jgi:predicted RNase H-like HicB family nuclease
LNTEPHIISPETMTQYIALIHKDAGSDFGVSFPDLPGCVTAGRTLDEARAFAMEALALHLEGLAEDGEAIPAPSSLEDIMAEAANRDAVAVLVPAPETADKIVRVNITLPETVLKAIDREAERQGMTRSGFLVRAAKREFTA